MTEKLLTGTLSLNTTNQPTQIIGEPKYKYGRSKEPQQKYHLGTVGIKILGREVGGGRG